MPLRAHVPGALSGAKRGPQVVEIGHLDVVGALRAALRGSDDDDGVVGEDVQLRLCRTFGWLQVVAQAEQTTQEGKRSRPFLALEDRVPRVIAERGRRPADYLRA